VRSESSAPPGCDSIDHHGNTTASSPLASRRACQRGFATSQQRNQPPRQLKNIHEGLGVPDTFQVRVNDTISAQLRTVPLDMIAPQTKDPQVTNGITLMAMSL